MRKQTGLAHYLSKHGNSCQSVFSSASHLLQYYHHRPVSRLGSYPFCLFSSSELEPQSCCGPTTHLMLFQPSSLLKQGFYIHMRQVLMFHPSLGGNIPSSGIYTYSSARGPSYTLRSLWDGALRISGSKKVSMRSEAN